MQRLQEDSALFCGSGETTKNGARDAQSSAVLFVKGGLNWKQLALLYSYGEGTVV